MSDQLPPIQDDDFSGETMKADPQRTRPNQPTGYYNQWQQPSPPPSTGNVPPVNAPRRPTTNTGTVVDPRRRQRQAQKENGLYLPLWSLAFMLVIVLGLSVGIVAMVYALGGMGTVVEEDPIIVIITAEPSPMGATDGNVETVLATPTLPDISQNFSAPDNLSLSGPTLPPVEISPTPKSLALNEAVIVDGVGDNQLNVRNIAGVNGTDVLFRAPDGTEFIIISGPQQADGFTWWQIQDPNNPSLSGWAVSNYLQVIPAQQP